MTDTLPAATDALDVTALRGHLDGDHHATREQVRALLAQEAFALPAPDIGVAEHRARVFEQARLVAGTASPALGFPTEFGGEDDPGRAVVAFEMLAHGDLSLLVKIGVQFGLFGGAILHLGTRAHHEAYLLDVATLELPGCFAMTEGRHGSDVQSLRTTATYDPEADEFVIDTPSEDDHKEWIGNAAEHGRMAAVFAQLVVDGTTHGIHCLLVPLRDADGNVLDGIRIEDSGHKLGLNGVDNGRIWFDDVRIPRANLLDRFGHIDTDGSYHSPIESQDRRFFTMLGTLVQGRVSVAGAGVSAAKSALAIAVRYAERRRQFGPPDGGAETVLLDYPAHQRRLLPRLARTVALHAAQQELRDEFHRVFTVADVDPQERRELESHAAGLKAAATWHATDVIQECREACGGNGYRSENRFAALKADTDVFTTFEGDNTVLLQLVAKSLVSGFQAEFGQLDPWDIAGWFAEEVVERIVEQTSLRQLVERLKDAVPRPGEDDAGLFDHDYLLEMFRWREEHVLGGLIRRLRRRIDDGQDSYDAFLACQPHVIETARVHVERQVVEAFHRSVEAAPEGPVRDCLTRLFRLHALAELEADRGWFQEHGRLSGERSKAITAAVDRLVGEVRADASTIVDAFGIPDEVLAPIAGD